MDINFKRYHDLLKRHKKNPLKEDLIQLLKTTREAKELELNQNAFARLKKKLLPQFQE